MPADRAPKQLYPRIVDRLLTHELLGAFPAVLIVGPRGSGKSTSAAALADTVLDLSVPGVRAAAIEDPDGVLAACAGRVVIDEWQEAPEILGAVKRAIDSGAARAGRFIITGSVRASRQAVTWPGTGRLIRVRMFGLTQSELLRDNGYNPVDAFFGDADPGWAVSSLARSDYIDRLITPRFPAALDLHVRNRSRWLDAYVDQLVERDARQVAAGSPQPAKVRAVLGSAAARTAQELNIQAAARDAGVARVTSEAHLALLEDLSIIARVPAWETSRLRRLNRAPKVHVLDSAMAAHLLHADADVLVRDATLVGQLLETFVAGELLAHCETTSDRTTLHHLRSRDGHEVDLVLERRARIVGVEVKSSTQVDRSAARGLLRLRDALGSNFHAGFVLYTGPITFRLDDRIWALPVDALWRPA